MAKIGKINSSIPVRQIARTLAASVRRPPGKSSEAKKEHAFKKEWSNALGGEKLLQEDEAHFSRQGDPEKLLEEWLNTETGFASEYIRVRGANGEYNPIELDEYQLDLFEDDGRFGIVKKSRRIGISYWTSMRGLIRCHLYDSHDSYYISRNLEEAKEKIKYAREMYEAMPDYIRKKLSSRSVKSQLEWESHDGKCVSRMISHPQTEPRGREGDIYLDEFASYLKQHDVYMASMGCLLRTGTLWIVSTPRNKGDIFHAVDAGEGDSYRAFNGHRYVIPWWHCKIMVKPGKLEEAMVQAPKMNNTADRVYAYGSDRVIEIYEGAGSEGDFQVEMECQYADDSTSAFPDAVLIKNTYNPIDQGWSQVDWGEQAPTDYPMDAHLDGLRISRMYFQDLDAFVSAFERGYQVGNSFVLGVDTGYTDGCAVVAIDMSGIVPATRMVAKLTNVGYSGIESKLISLIRKLPIRRVGIDTRAGEGRALHSRLTSIIDNGQERILSIPVDININNDLFVLLKEKFEKSELAIPMDGDLIADIKKVRRELTSGMGIPTIKVNRDRRSGHGDRYFALTYAVHCLPRQEDRPVRMATPNYQANNIPRRQFGRPSSNFREKYKKTIHGDNELDLKRSDQFADIRLDHVLNPGKLPRP